MTGIEYFLGCYKNYSKVTGRATRKEFGYFMLFYLIFYLGISYALAYKSINYAHFFQGVFYLVSYIPALAVFMRRMHDIGKPGVFVFVPIVNIILAFIKSEKGENIYGPNPNHLL